MYSTEKNFQEGKLSNSLTLCQYNINAIEWQLGPLVPIPQKIHLYLTGLLYAYQIMRCCFYTEV